MGGDWDDWLKRGRKNSLSEPFSTHIIDGDERVVKKKGMMR